MTITKMSNLKIVDTTKISNFTATQQTIIEKCNVIFKKNLLIIKRLIFLQKINHILVVVKI